MSFKLRHIGNITNYKDLKKMMRVCGVTGFNDLIEKTNIIKNFDKNDISNIPLFDKEHKAQSNLKDIIDKNLSHQSYIGLGYYNTRTPYPIKRHLVENAQWYTSYTPYQAEISQGRLESQYNFQTVVKELTQLPIANASLLDEASAAGEALNLSYAYYKKKRNKFIVSDSLHPQTLDVLETRAKTLNLEMNIVNILEKEKTLNSIFDLDNIDPNDICNIIFQYPDTYGEIYIPDKYLNYATENNILTTAVTDLLALTKIKSPGELGINIALGSSQRFGIPLWYGGPHPAFFSVSKELLRLLPGRIIGVSKDKNGDKSFRLALQTREQHIKRQSATSNICTSQSLLTNVVSMYCVYYGPHGLTKKANEVIDKTKYLANNLSVDIDNTNFFDTITFTISEPDTILDYLKHRHTLLRKNKDDSISITIDETITYKDLDKLIDFINQYQKNLNQFDLIYYKKDNNKYNTILDEKLYRETEFLKQEIFNKYNTETELLRYMNQLALKDYTLCNGMIPLGSCTMKLNATYQLEPLLWDKVANIHPFVPKEFSLGYQELIEKTGNYLKILTGFDAISFQPNSGATGEYAGLLCIKKYHEENNNEHRNICLIPKSAHGTNFASASVANLKVEVFDDKLLDNADLFKEYVEKFKDNLAGLMITYPNTNGVFQKNIETINEIIHNNGGLVYMDGANMNALVGIFSPAKVGFDVCHLNLHKTFCIPHGGGGPGLGPILCYKKLEPFLPTNSIQVIDKTNESCGYVSASNYSSAALLCIPYLYITAMGIEGLTKATKMAILNSNYLKEMLKSHYAIIDVNENGMVGHEFIIDVSKFRNIGITENDIAKRLIDYSFHPPTMSWPRSGVLMFEPTESESKEELDRLIEAMISIRNEIKDIENNKYSKDNNLLKNAPHNFKQTINWEYPYSIKEAFYPVDNLFNKKFNVQVSRVDDVYGDKQLLSSK